MKPALSKWHFIEHVYVEKNFDINVELFIILYFFSYKII